MGSLKTSNIEKYTIYGVAALTLVTIGYIILKKRKASAATLEYIPAPLEIVDISNDPYTYSGDAALVSALGMEFDENSNDFQLLALNRPPLSAENDKSTDLNSSYNQSMQSRFTLDQYISEKDYEALQQLNIIPLDFPLEQITFTRSHNGVNKFMVGYSSPYTQTTSATPIANVIRPLWAVSFDTEFDPRFQPLEGIDDADFRKFGAKMLYAEGLLTRANDGCHQSQGQNECNAEKSALMQILLNRLALKKQKINSNLTFSSVFSGSNQLWNAGSAFMNPFNKGPDSVAQDRFDDFYEYKFWHMPNLSDNASHFIHHFAISNTPSWVAMDVMTPTQDFANYANQRPIRIGRAIVADNSRTFK